MAHDSRQILAVLDACCETFTFPMLDNGYVYLAATRLSIHWSRADWGVVIEVFGYSPRSGSPDVHVHSFASRLHGRKTKEQFITEEAHTRYVSLNRNNESQFFFPCDGSFQDPDDDELLDALATDVVLRGQPLRLPPITSYADLGISLVDPPRVHVFELCRYLAATHRDLVLATPAERTIHIRPDMRQLLVLDEWNHPDLLSGERPSTSSTFQQLAHALSVGDASAYHPAAPPNTHWRFWPDGGSL